MTMTSVERLAQIQADLLQPDAGPQIARRHLVTLTAMWGDFRAEATRTDLAFKQVLGAARAVHRTAADARMAAEASPEYGQARKAKDDEAFCLELIRSCKAAMRSIDEEMRLSR
jgi:hypothetical protein